MDDVPLSTLFGVLIFLFLCSAFFSGTETALMCLNRYRLRHLASSGHRGARLAEKLLKHPDRLIGLILFCNNLVNNACAALATLVALRVGGPAAVVFGTVIVTVALLIFGEVTPKTLAATHPERLAFRGACFYHAVLRFLPPIGWSVRIITWCSNTLLRMVGVRPEEGGAQHLTIEELRTILAESSAALPRKRHEMLTRVLELGEITVEDIIIPRNEVVGIDLDDDWAKNLDIIRSSGHTRLPAYRGALDNVVGLLRVKRILILPAGEELTPTRLEKLLDEPYFVPEGTPLNKQLVQFQRNRQRTGFVVDEYGEIQGIVTLEDLLQEIVGGFTSQPGAGDADIRRDDSGGYIVNAATNVRILNRMMNWELPTDGPKTLNGLIVEQLDGIPRKGTHLMLNDYAVEILQIRGHTVEKVQIREPAGTLSPFAAEA